MSDEQYTPTDEQVRADYPFDVRWFDRWLRAHDAQVQAEQREKDAQIAADAYSTTGWHSHYLSASLNIAAAIRGQGVTP